MSAAEKKKAAAALLACLATPDIGELVQDIDDGVLRALYSRFLSRLVDVRDGGAE